MKKILISLIFGIMLISSVSASFSSLGDGFILGQDANLKQLCGTCTFNNITSITYPNGTDVITNQTMTKSQTEFNYILNGSLITVGRTYTVNGFGDEDGINTVWAFTFEVSEEGIVLTTPESISLTANSLLYIALILLFIGLGMVFYNLTSKVNLEEWDKKIYSRYENKNYVKLVLSSIGYNIMKNTFIVYYLIGLPIIFMLLEVSTIYNIPSLIIIMNFFIVIYLIGLSLVGIMFLSNIQEWFMDLLGKVRDMDWGIKE